MRACVANATERCCGSGYEEIWPYLVRVRARVRVRVRVRVRARVHILRAQPCGLRPNLTQTLTLPLTLNLRVHILRAQPCDHHEHKGSRDAQPARQSFEELLGVARWPARQAAAVEDLVRVRARVRVRVRVRARVREDRGGEAGRAHEQENVLHRVDGRGALWLG